MKTLAVMILLALFAASPDGEVSLVAPADDTPCCETEQEGLTMAFTPMEPATIGTPLAPKDPEAEEPETGTITGLANHMWFRRIEGVVFIREVKGKTFPVPEENPVMDQKNLIFTPHVLPVLVGSTVNFPNSDTVRHNVYSTKASSTVFNLGTYPSDVVKTVKFEKTGYSSLLCNVHAEMSAFVVVCQNPYFATVDTKTRKFEIKDVPAGTYQLAVFHEKVKAKDLTITVEAGKTVEVELKDFSKK